MAGPCLENFHLLQSSALLWRAQGKAGWGHGRTRAGQDSVPTRWGVACGRTASPAPKTFYEFGAECAWTPPCSYDGSTTTAQKKKRGGERGEDTARGADAADAAADAAAAATAALRPLLLPL